MYSTRTGSLKPNTRLYMAAGLSVVPAYIAFTQLEAVKNETAAQEERATEQVELEVVSVETQEPSEVESKDDHSGAAYNPETGEINWDCPCLGGMAHGPCGEEFKEAFACFVYSESEPKGVDCITKFSKMRECFREHPEHYKEELYDDDAAAQSELEAEEVHVAETGTESEPAANTIEKVESLTEAGTAYVSDPASESQSERKAAPKEAKKSPKNEAATA